MTRAGRRAAPGGHAPTARPRTTRPAAPRTWPGGREWRSSAVILVEANAVAALQVAVRRRDRLLVLLVAVAAVEARRVGSRHGHFPFADMRAMTAVCRLSLWVVYFL